jgi:hypothetical protein
MRSGAIPFQFDVTSVLARFARAEDGRPSAVRLDLPFISVLAHPNSTDVKLARELLVRMKDRRVLSAQECCDSCIDEALASLQQIRGLLVELQVRLSETAIGPLTLLIDLMVVGIRQFLTFEQKLEEDVPPRADRPQGRSRSWHTQQIYFDALELLRGHLSRCLGQIAVVAGLNVPSDVLIPNYHGPWQLSAYVAPRGLVCTKT